MPRASFRVSLTPRKAGDAFVFTENGYEDAEFLISVNQGEPHVPVSKCASGGEMSRIMLAIKSVIARHDGMPTVIFDEVDSGVSGKTARKIGYSLQKSSLGAQIICVTHSAQIASLADVHLFVFKHESEGRTEASVRALSREERIIELSRILGGIHVTEAQRKAAEDMLTEGNK
jgi:DNA repair protein RecN (Recombination protein N)